jgi:uncharacterized protein (DUF362 family)/Pyruvate/2-oxoacid:ferredoxin oxidoreductase delta subunit
LKKGCEEMKVAVVKVSNIGEEESICEGVRKAINLVGGMHSIVKRGDTVIVKPNFSGPRSPLQGATTSLTVVREIVNEVIECGAEPIIAEGPFRFYNADVVFDTLGVRRFAKELGIKLVNLNEEASVEVEVPSGKALKRIKVPKPVLDSDVLINVPKMKTHHLTTVTLGMKNLKGVLPGAEKQQSHIHGIHQSIVDINKIIKPDLTVVDGIVAMEGMGPTFGDPVELGLVVAGRNVVDVDKVCCEIMGIDPFHVEHLRIALEEGLGSNNVEVVGEPINSVRRKFRVPQESRVYLYLSNAAQRLDRLVYKISGKNIFPYLSGMFGKRPRIDKKKCVKCGICEKVCIVSPPAIDCKAGKINYQRCVDCLLCMEQCPRNAISVRGMVVK